MTDVDPMVSPQPPVTAAVVLAIETGTDWFDSGLQGVARVTRDGVEVPAKFADQIIESAKELGVSIVRR